MWNVLKKTVSAEQKGEMVGAFLPGYASLAARDLVEQMPQLQDGHYAEGTLDLLLEMIAFYMHVANRLAFRELGAEQCDRFSRRMMVTTANSVTTSLSHDLSSADVVAELRDKYNESENYYAQFRQFVPGPDQPHKNTLFWEFGRVIFDRFIRTDDTGDLLVLNRFLAVGISAFLKKTNEALKA